MQVRLHETRTKYDGKGRANNLTATLDTGDHRYEARFDVDHGSDPPQLTFKNVVLPGEQALMDNETFVGANGRAPALRQGRPPTWGISSTPPTTA